MYSRFLSKSSVFCPKTSYRVFSTVVFALSIAVFLCCANVVNATGSGFLLTVVKGGTGVGTVTASTGTLTWNGNTGTAVYVPNTQVILTAIPGKDSMFDGWTGCSESTANRCTVIMTEAKNVAVDFKFVRKKTKKDLDGNGKSDVLLQNSSTGDVVVWLMDGTNKMKTAYVANGVPTSWKVRAVHDFNGDGKADVLWHNVDTGDVYVWLMDGTTATSGAFAANGISSDWHIRGIGDFDGDGKNDVMWQNSTTGAVYIWLMAGNTQKSGGFAVKGMEPDWQFKGVGDFDGDDKADVLWQNKNTGDVYIWLMDGTSIKKGDYISYNIPADWLIKTVADFDGDGKDDIHWQNTRTGNVYIWLMDGTTIKGGDFVKPKGSGILFREMIERGASADGWDTKSVGDFNGDSKNDMLWQNNTNGDLYLWFMDGTGISSGGLVEQSLPSNWSIY
ncbi:MAG: VCBS repeat-containing protein [Nitrospirae bacterium]|nr:VCBS repeat-containing protein [Nitrospirota bacterium]